MITDRQVLLMRQKLMEGKSQETAAAMAGMSVRSARNWQQGPLPLEKKEERLWRTRADPFEGVWEEEIEPLLRAEAAQGLRATTIIEYLEERALLQRAGPGKPGPPTRRGYGRGGPGDCRHRRGCWALAYQLSPLHRFAHFTHVNWCLHGSPSNLKGELSFSPGGLLPLALWQLRQSSCKLVNCPILLSGRTWSTSRLLNS